VFAPAPAVRVRPAGFTGTPMPKDEPMAANPEGGAVIDYVVRGAVSGPLVLSILDADGALVRRYSSEDRPKAADLARLRIAPEWAPSARPLSIAAGMHRFVWPLRYAAPAALAQDDPRGDGVWAPPGRYSVELTVDGQRLRQPLTVLADPRVTLSADVYTRQFALARRVEAAAARVAAAIDEADKLHRALSERARMGADEAKAIEQRDIRVQALTGPQFGEAPVGPAPAGLASLRALAGTLRGFAAAVDGADTEPTPDVEAGFAKLEPAVEATLAAWEALKASTRASNTPVSIRPARLTWTNSR
jgi:hypothetical protein